VVELVDFIRVADVPAQTRQKYEAVLPAELLEVWDHYGFGTFYEGFLRVIDPDEYLDVLAESYERSAEAIPIMLTGMGDIVYWQNGFVEVVHYRRGRIATLAKGVKMLFVKLFAGLSDDSLAMEPYRQAVPVLGQPDYDECFGYVPLLGLGGPEKVDHLKRVKVREHILLITTMVGPVQ
jgi:hypothetical protein